MEKLTILMTTCNEEKQIFCNALESILNQTFREFKLLIVVDNNKNKEIIDCIKNFEKKDDRISYIINEKNMGLAESLNKGIDAINTKYIARMDADDISTPDRIEKQMKYAENHQDIVLFGSNIIYIDYNGKFLYKRNLHQTNYKSIKKTMEYMNVFHHPTFFGKTEIFKKYKYRQLKYSQDYDFVCRLLEDNCIIGNMSDYLLYYRLPQNINNEKKYMQRMTYYCIQKKYKTHSLNKTNIKLYVEENLKCNNKDKIIKGIELYDEAIKKYKQKKYINFLKCIIKSFCISKYQRIQIINIIKYYVIRRI